MKTYRPGQKRSRLFARLNPNFSSGRYAPPSKNRAQQSRLFRSTNPYAKDSQVMRGIQPVQATGMSTGVYRPPAPTSPEGMAMLEAAKAARGGMTDPMRSVQPVGQPVQMNPTNIGDPVFQPPATNIGDPVSSGSFIIDKMRQMYGQSAGQGGLGPMVANDGGSGLAGLEGLQGLAGLTPEQLEQVKQLNPNTDIRNTAQGMAGMFAGNPFMSPEGLQQLQRGYVPTDQQVNPAFYRYTSPVIQQMLAGLRTSVGYRPEDQAFTQQQFTPMGLR